VSRPLIRAWYAIAVSFVACLAIALAGVAYTNYVQKQAERRAEAVRIESDRRWCALLVDISRGQRESPPKTESGQRFAEEIDRLRREFGCPEP
jgi:hypothetical protein